MAQLQVTGCYLQSDQYEKTPICANSQAVKDLITTAYVKHVPFQTTTDYSEMLGTWGNRNWIV